MKFFFLFFLCLFTYHCSAQHIETKVMRGLTDGKIAQYGTIEIGISIPEFEFAYHNFLFPPPTTIDHTPPAKNPFFEKFLRVQFTCHGKFYTADAFYMQEAAPNEKANRYTLTDTKYPWRIRFAVPDTGEWRTVILIGDDVIKAVPKNCPVNFTCVKGNNHGYLGVAKDKKHFQYTDGNLFFAIGQNIAWADEPVLHGHAGPPPVYSAGYFDVYDYINSLADNGGNYVRIVMVKWSTGIEWENAGVYDQAKSCALDSMIALAEKRGLKIHLCINPTLGWNQRETGDDRHVYRKQFQKEGESSAELLRDSSVLFYMDNYLRYVHARWGFSPAVATLEIIGEVNVMEGWDEHERYFSNYYSHAEKFIREELGDTLHMISTSMSNTHPTGLFHNPAISFADMHHYDNNFKCNQKRFHYVQSYSRKYDKPFLFGEMGMIPGPVNSADPDDYEHCNDISFHNALWSTAFMGAAGTGLPWWQWKFNAYRENNFAALEYFLDSVVGKNIFSTELKLWTGNGLECFYMKNKYHQAFGWVHNTSYWWGNMMQDCKDRNGKKMALPADDDQAALTEKREGNEFHVKGFERNRWYEITFYDTRSRNKVISSKLLKSNVLGVVAIPFPGQADYAFRIKRYFPGKF